MQRKLISSSTRRGRQETSIEDIELGKDSSADLVDSPLNSSRRRVNSYSRRPKCSRSKSRSSNLRGIQAFGKVNFVTDDEDTSSEYALLDHESDKDNILKLLKEDWQLQKPGLVISKPGLVISITGAAQDVKELETRDRERYFEAIVNAAVSTDAWIITGGTDAGVMKYTGDAVRKHRETIGDEVTTLGIATWGVLKESHRKELTIDDDELAKAKQSRKKERHLDKWKFGGREKPSLGNYLEPKRLPPEKDESQDSDSVKTEEPGVDLNPNYTHFILVNSWTEIEVDGPKKTFGGEIKLRGELERVISKNWKESDKGGDTDIPVVCIVVNGGPGTIQTVNEAVKNDTPVIIVNKPGRAADVMAKIFEGQSIEGHEEALKKIIGSSDEAFEKKKKQIIECLNNERLINVCNFSSGAKLGKEMDKVILRALQKAELKSHDQYMLALKWNRFGMVADINETVACSQDEHEKWQDALTYALVHNRSKFIEHILKIVRIKDYLTNETLEQLYNEAMECKDTGGILKRLLKETTQKEKEKLKLSDIDDVIKILTGGAIAIDHSKLDKENEFRCWQKLFLFSVLNGFDKMAEDFWDRGQEAIPTALAASKLYKSLASLKHNEGNEWNDRMRSNTKKYEDWACQILTRCHSDYLHGRCKLKPHALITRVLPNWGNVTCLNLADSAESLKFLSHPVVKDLLDDNWDRGITGCGMIPWTPWKYIFEPMKLLLLSVIPFLIPYFVTLRHDDPEKSRCQRWMTKIGRYYAAPRTIFWHNVVSHVLFIILFSYNLLWGEFDIPPLKGSWIDTLLFVWVCSMLFEEVRQMFEWEANTLWLRLTGWWSNNWNKIDILAQLLFLLGTFLRYSTKPVTVENARILLAFDLFIFYIRLLEYLTFVKRIGPKVIMIGRMFIDLVFFVCILFIVLVGYGITVHVILYPDLNQPKTVFESVLFLFIDEITATPDDGSCTFNFNETTSMTSALGSTPCTKHPRIGTVLLALYLAFTNVLLLNLLIAMFSNTFIKVQEQNDIHWKFQRYALQKEYIDKPMFPPPLILLSLLGRVLFYLLFILEGICDSDISLSYYFRVAIHSMRANDNKDRHKLVQWEERKATQFKQHHENETQKGKNYNSYGDSAPECY